jgi:hypothetical protein
MEWILDYQSFYLLTVLKILAVELYAASFKNGGND